MQRDHLDIWGGVALAVFGLAVAFYSVNHYDFGELRRIGPGFFPTVLGGILVLLGIAVAVPAFLRSGTTPKVDLKEALFILAAVVVFAVLIERVGILLSTFVTVLITTIPAPKPGLLWRVVTAIVVSAISWAIFVAGLGMPLDVFPWGR
ncbi:tripartite tricarboxylate transporter TctB family protein [Pseudoruegeria sp. HB172150]|uniref:tripartite tricarboxylate transporter TctB family protein n=1 Tax=Pseudoruegeria sp. HB172150 TaxID=2721164 RepID=UPI001551F983|nr:tripartite tricarboxylate transporter TctB family protein [Pseudoruegeria sp. HB172150]